MFELYTLTIANNKSCYTKNAYKIFFIILELISNYQLSSLLIILFSGKNVSSPGDAFFLLLDAFWRLFCLIAGCRMAPSCGKGDFTG